MTSGKRVAPTRRYAFGPADAVFLYLLGGLALVLVLAAAVPLVLGLSPYVVTSTSMEPTLSRGDLIFVKPTAFEELRPNDIVTVRVEEGVFTHRVYSLDRDGGTLRTRADGSLFLDSFSVAAEDVVGRVAYRLPLLGHVSLFWGEREATE